MKSSTASDLSLQSRIKGGSSRSTRGGLGISPPIRICFFDQNPISLDQLTHLLPHPGFQIVSENDLRARESSSAEGRLILVMDQKHLSPEQQPFLQILVTRFPDAKLLVLGEEPPQWDGCDAMRFIHGFVPYSQAKRNLAPALQTLSNGDRWLPRAAFEYLAQLAAHSNGTPKTARFTPREEAIILMLVGQLSNKEIAGRLHITERTVKFHLANVFDKLGVQDRHSVAELAESLPGLNPHLVAA